MTSHGLRDAVPGEQTLERCLLKLRSGGTVKEPADKGDPDPSAKVAGEHLQHAEKDEQQSEDPAGVCRDDRRTAHVHGDPPNNGAKHAAAIEWIAGDEVEQPKGQVDIRQVLDQTEKRLTESSHGLERVEQDPEAHANEGTHDGDQKLSRGTWGLGLDLRDAAENEERNAPHGNAVSERDHGMPKFMQENAHKKHDRSDRPHDPIEG